MHSEAPEKRNTVLTAGGLSSHSISPTIMFIILSCSQTQQNKFVNWQGDAEVRGDDFTATVTLGNPDVLAGSGMFQSANTLAFSARVNISPPFWDRFQFPEIGSSNLLLCT